MLLALSSALHKCQDGWIEGVWAIQVSFLKAEGVLSIEFRVENPQLLRPRMTTPILPAQLFMLDMADAGGGRVEPHHPWEAFRSPTSVLKKAREFGCKTAAGKQHFQLPG